MAPRRLIAALACRAGGSRLYGKPLQNLADNLTILDIILRGAQAGDELDGIVLGISEGIENFCFTDYAKKYDIDYIFGDQRDVLWRLIQCGRAGAATDVFRVTTECPFPAWELVASAWRQHLGQENDITVSDFLPEGCHFEIYKLEALELSHREGKQAERSEFCSAFARRRHDLFRIGLIEPPAQQKRMDLRLTVDYPEDLVLCREVYRSLEQESPRIPIDKIIEFVDGRPDLLTLVSPYVVSEPLWAHTIARD